MQQTVLILGARGRFGLVTAHAFAAAGWRVLAQMRPGAQVPPDAQGDARIAWLPIDVHDTDALTRAARAQSGAAGVAVVVHALNPAYTNAAWKAQVLPLTERALALCRALDATLMLPGNVYNFGTGMPALLDEDTPQEARTIKGQIRIGMEEMLRRSGVPSVVIRAGDFFGGGRGNWFDMALVRQLGRGVFTYPGALDTAKAWAYLPDLARSFVAVAQRRNTLRNFDVLHFAGHTVSARDWLSVLTPLAQSQAWVTGGALRTKEMPWTVIRLGGWLVPTWAALAEMRYLWDTPHALANGKLTALIGPEPHTPLPVATQQALTELGLLPGAAGYLAGTKPAAL